MGNSVEKQPPHPLEELTKPNGVYPKCSWDDKTIKQLIYAQRLAPRFPPLTEEASDTEECPICCFNYRGGLNVSICCGQIICTECYFQVKKPGTADSPCPYCQGTKFRVSFRPMQREQCIKEREEAQQAEEAERRARSQSDATPEAQRQRQRAEALLREPVQFPSPTPPPSYHLHPTVAAAAGARRPRTATAAAAAGAAAAAAGGRGQSGSAAERSAQGRSRVRNAPVALPTGADANWGDLLQRLAADPTLRRSAAEIEQLMIMEAIRVSLLEDQQRQQQQPQQQQQQQQQQCRQEPAAAAPVLPDQAAATAPLAVPPQSAAAAPLAVAVAVETAAAAAAPTENVVVVAAGADMARPHPRREMPRAAQLAVSVDRSHAADMPLQPPQDSCLLALPTEPFLAVPASPPEPFSPVAAPTLADDRAGNDAAAAAATTVSAVRSDSPAEKDDGKQQEDGGDADGKTVDIDTAMLVAEEEVDPCGGAGVGGLS